MTTLLSPALIVLGVLIALAGLWILAGLPWVLIVGGALLAASQIELDTEHDRDVL